MRTSSPRGMLVLVSALAGAAAPLAGCGEPIDPVDLADQAALRAREIVHQSGGGVSFAAADDSGLQKIGTGTSDSIGGVMGMMPAPVPPGMMSAMAGGAMAMAAAGVPSMMDTEEQFDDTADRLRVFLRQRILADSNLESRSDDQAIYLLRPDPTCRSIPDPSALDQTTTTIDQHCVDQLTRLPVRIALRADGDGVRLTVLIGPDRLELSSFVIHSNLLAMETDFAMAYAASQVIDQTLGSDSPNPTQYETLVGRTRLSLRKDGERQVTGAVSVLQAIHIATRDAAGAPGPDVQIGAGDPALAVTADGVAQSLTVKVGVGAIDVLGDWDPRGLQAAPNRDLRVSIGGLTGETTFTEANDEIVSRGLGVGDVAVDVRGAHVFQLGLNPADMHRFDLRVALDAAGQPQFEVTPRFDLSLGFHLGLVAADLTSEPPSFAVDEVYGVRLEGGGAPATFMGAPASGAFAGGLKIGAGTLTLSSSKVAEPLVVPAGKCLTSVAEPPAGAHPVLGSVAVVDCP